MTTVGTEHIIKALQLPRLGRKTAFKLFKNLNFKLTCDNDLFEYIKENSGRFRLPEYSTNEIKKAIDNYSRINDLNQKNGIKSISYFDENYPERFKCINDSPIVLNYLGDFKNLNNIPAVAIVGTREPSENGLKAAYRFGEIFGEGGFNVVSGLALGCDTGGHRGCLKTNGFTSAVLAHGLDHVYPKENKKLADEILKNG